MNKPHTRAEQVAEELCETLGRGYEAEAGPVARGGMEKMAEAAYRRAIEDAAKEVEYWSPSVANRIRALADAPAEEK